MLPLSEAIRRFLVPWRTVDWPYDWTQTFGRPGELVLEVGFGNGEFLADQARRHPERNHVGIEISWTSVLRLFTRIEKHGLENVRIVLADAEATLALLFASGSIAHTFVNHPCPWPKDRHEKRRLLQPRFLELLADRMTTGGDLLVVTDHAAYAAEIGALLEGQTAFAARQATTEVDTLEGRLTTKYERKARDQGISIHYFPWTKVAEPERLPTGPLLEHDMPSTKLSGPHDAEHLFDGFEALSRRELVGDLEIVVRFTGLYRDQLAPRPRYVVETLVLEGTLRQDFLIAVQARAEGDLLVKLTGLGFPKPTWGAKRAVACLTEWLTAHNEGLEVAHENLGQAYSSTSD